MTDHFDVEHSLRTASLELYVEELEHDLRVAQQRIDELEVALKHAIVVIGHPDDSFSQYLETLV